MFKAMTLTLTVLIPIVSQANKAAPVQEERPYTVTYASSQQTKSPCLLTVAPAEGYEFKKETPFRAYINSTEGITLQDHEPNKPTYRVINNQQMDYKTQPGAGVLQTQYTTTTEASHSAHLTAHLRFFICNDELCKRYQETKKCSINSKS